MMNWWREMERYHIIKSVFGGSDIYDSSGNQVGYSLPGILGDGEDFYKMDGTPIGQSYHSVLGHEYFSGPKAYGFIDQEILMDRNAYLQGVPFEQELKHKVYL